MAQFEFRVVRTNVDPTNSYAVVTIAFKNPTKNPHEAYEQLISPSAMTVAFTGAVQAALTNPGINGQRKVFGVDSEGKPLQPNEMDKLADWYCDVPVSRKMT